MTAPRRPYIDGVSDSGDGPGPGRPLTPADVRRIVDQSIRQHTLAYDHDRPAPAPDTDGPPAAPVVENILPWGPADWISHQHRDTGGEYRHRHRMPQHHYYDVDVSHRGHRPAPDTDTPATPATAPGKPVSLEELIHRHEDFVGRYVHTHLPPQAGHNYAQGDAHRVGCHEWLTPPDAPDDPGETAGGADADADADARRHMALTSDMACCGIRHGDVREFVTDAAQSTCPDCHAAMIERLVARMEGGCGRRETHKFVWRLLLQYADRNLAEWRAADLGPPVAELPVSETRPGLIRDEKAGFDPARD